MSRVRSEDSRPEMVLRRLAHGLGYRYRLHQSHLPGKPDLVFPGRRSVIFMHGCYWHQHEGCGLARPPKPRISFWMSKFEASRERDRWVKNELQQFGWRVLVISECELGDLESVERSVVEFLETQ